MGKLFMAIGQIAVGVAVGNVASDMVNKVSKSVKKVIESKKAGS